MAPGRSRPRRFPCRNLSPSSISLSPGPNPSRHPTLGPAAVPAPAPAPVHSPALASVATNDLFKQFMKAYLEMNQGPRQPPAERERSFKAKILEVYYGKLHIECYHFCQQCEDYFETAGATKTNWTPFAASFLCGNISLRWT